MGQFNDLRRAGAHGWPVWSARELAERMGLPWQEMDDAVQRARRTAVGYDMSGQCAVLDIGCPAKIRLVHVLSPSCSSSPSWVHDVSFSRCLRESFSDAVGLLARA